MKLLSSIILPMLLLLGAVSCGDPRSASSGLVAEQSRDDALRAAVADADTERFNALLRQGNRDGEEQVLNELLFSDYVLCKPEMLELLVNSGADPNYMDEVTSTTPLLFIAGLGHTPCVLKLLSLGADPHHRDHLNEGLVWRAVQAKSSEILRLAISLGVSLDEPVQPRMRTPLDLAIGMKDKVAVSALAEAGAHACGIDADGVSRVELIRSFDQEQAKTLEANCSRRTDVEESRPFR